MSKKQKTKSIKHYGDQSYIEARNKLIPEAVKHANKFVSEGAWNRAYHREMKRLCHERFGCPL